MKKRYTIEILEDETGQLEIKDENKGFTIFEILGFVEMYKDKYLRYIRNGTKKTLHK